jgi:hypothetical protein
MSDILTETIYKRCEEVLLNDEMCRRSNERIVQLENRLKKTLTSDQLAQYNQIEGEISQATSRNEFLLYKQGFIDGNNIK